MAGVTGGGIGPASSLEAYLIYIESRTYGIPFGQKRRDRYHLNFPRRNGVKDYPAGAMRAYSWISRATNTSTQIRYAA